MNFDVIVVGAGPAGLSSALSCSKRGLKTLLVEKTPMIGVFLKTSGHTFISDVFDKFNIPKKFIASKINSFYFHSLANNENVEIKWKEYLLCTLDHYAFFQFLAASAIKHGCSIMLSTEAISVLLNSKTGFVEGIKAKLSDGAFLEIRSKLVIDASGPFSPLCVNLGLSNKQNKSLDYGIEFDMENVLIKDPHRIEYYAGYGVVPIGYAWIAPKSKTRAAVGIETVLNSPTSEFETFVKKTGQNLFDCFHNFTHNHPIASKKLAKSQPIEFRQGHSRISGMLKKPFYEGFLAVGDSACQTNPLLGEGIRYAITFGDFAAKTAQDSIRAEDFSSEYLSKYADLCKKYLGKNYDATLDSLNMPTDEYWNGLITSLQELVQKSREDLVLKYMRGEV